MGDPATLSYSPPRTREQLVIAAISIALVAYLPIVIHRTVVKGFGDVQVFFRAAWAVWTGFPLYDVVDSHGWSYHYPPTFALIMAPFANPLPDYLPPSWAMPYPVAVGVWYLINAVALLAAMHVWAGAIERTSDVKVQQAYWQPWWALRLAPLIALLPFAGDGLGRGQPTALLVLLMVGFVALYAGGRRNTAALLLAVAATIKIYPIALAFIPLLRRDWWTLAWLGGWCLILLVGLPIACLGPAATADLFQTLWFERLSGIATGTPSSRVLIEVSPWSFDMGSIGSMLARVFTRDLPEPAAPFPTWAKQAQLAANLILVTMLGGYGYRRFWIFSARQPDDPYSILVAGAVLMAALPLMLATAQPNYLAHAIPLVAVLMLEAWRRIGQSVITPRMVACTILAWLAMIATDTKPWLPLSRVNPNTVFLLMLVAMGIFTLAKLRRSAIQPVTQSARS